MKQYRVTGMSCAACSTRVEKAVGRLDKVDSCAVNLLTGSMSVEGTASDKEIEEAVKNAGYGIATEKNDVDNDDKNSEFAEIKNRLIASVIFLVVLMYFSMGTMMWGWPEPEFLMNNEIGCGILQMILTTIIMVINQKFFVSGFKSLVNRAPNMDALVALGSGAAYIYSTYILIAMTGSEVPGDLYFESAGTILTLITVGKLLEARAKGKTTDALKSLMDLSPKTANIIIDGEERIVSVEKITKGTVFVVRPGERIPADGKIIEGISAIDEAALTGESIPVDKAPGDDVSAGTFNKEGFIKCEAIRVGEDTTISQIIKMVSDASASKAPIAKVADKVSGVFVPIVIIIALITFGVWLALGKGMGFALARGITVLVISCPCALGLATPVSIMVGNGRAARKGILFKNAEALEQTGKATVVAFDKTGTITKGLPEVTDIVTVDSTEDKLLEIALSLEIGSEHPLAKAIVQEALEHNAKAQPISEFKALPGCGVIGKLGDVEVFGGSLKYAEQRITGFSLNNEELIGKSQKLADEGKTPLIFGISGKIAGMIAVADVVKDDSTEAVSELVNAGIKTVMITGDNSKTAHAIGKLVGITEVISEVMPADKERVVSELGRNGKVIMVGDGINDAPALTRADIGIALGAGTDVAIDAADIVLMNDSLMDVAAAIKLSCATLRNIHQNLFWAFIYNVIGIPLAAGLFIPIFGWKLNPMFAAAAMSLSSFCVVTNALRLNIVKTDMKIGRKSQNNNNENRREKMKKTMEIEGMMCMHCEARVKKVLEALTDVETVDVSHEKGIAEVTMATEVADEVLRQAVEEQDYKVVNIK